VPRLVLGCALAVLEACGGGGAGYLARAGWAEARILLRRRPIAELLARPDLDPTLRERLELVRAVRAFAAGPLGLRVGANYATFAELDGDTTAYVLSAARRDRLAPYTWWYPVVGRVPYQGFFERRAADAAARRLAAQDLDVEVRPAVAFSTLGWFADPLLSTVAQAPPVALADTVIHELFHSTVYVPGDATFNESAATFAGHRGAIAFFCSGPGSAAAPCAEARRRWAVTRARATLFARVATQLRRVYAAGLPAARRERLRSWLAAAAAETLVRRGLGRREELVPPNNARLLGELVYGTDLDVFDRLAERDADLGPALRALVRAGRDGDALARVREAARLREGTALD